MGKDGVGRVQNITEHEVSSLQRVEEGLEPGERQAIGFGK
jgi:hypothetical protein